MRSALAAAVVTAVCFAPLASADPQDGSFTSYLAAHKVAVDRSTAIRAAHIVCVQTADRVPDTTISAILLQQMPPVQGAEEWIMAGARQIYCPNAGK